MVGRGEPLAACREGHSSEASRVESSHVVARRGDTRMPIWDVPGQVGSYAHASSRTERIHAFRRVPLPRTRFQIP